MPEQAHAAREPLAPEPVGERAGERPVARKEHLSRGSRARTPGSAEIRSSCPLAAARRAGTSATGHSASSPRAERAALPVAGFETLDLDPGMHHGDRRRRHAGSQQLALLRPRSGDEAGLPPQEPVHSAPHPGERPRHRPVVGDHQRNPGETGGETQIGARPAVERHVQDVGPSARSSSARSASAGKSNGRRSLPSVRTGRSESARGADQRAVAAGAEDHRPIAVAAQGAAGREGQALRAALAEIEKSEGHRAGSSGLSSPELLHSSLVPPYGTVADHRVESPDSKPSANSEPTSTRK